MPLRLWPAGAHPGRGRVPQDMGADRLGASRGRGIGPAEDATDQVVGDGGAGRDGVPQEQVTVGRLRAGRRGDRP